MPWVAELAAAFETADKAPLTEKGISSHSVRVSLDFNRVCVLGARRTSFLPSSL